MFPFEDVNRVAETIQHGGTAFLAALLLVLYWLQREDIKKARKEVDAERRHVADLETRIFELSGSYNRTIRKFETHFSATRELLNRIFDRI